MYLNIRHLAKQTTENKSLRSTYPCWGEEGAFQAFQREILCAQFQHLNLADRNFL